LYKFYKWQWCYNVKRQEVWEIKNVFYHNLSDCCAQGSTHTQVHNFKPTEFFGTIKMLNPGKSYIFRIQAETKIGYGPEAIWKQKMPILRKWYSSVCFKPCSEWVAKLVILSVSAVIDQMLFCHEWATAVCHISIHDDRYHIGLYFLSLDVMSVRPDIAWFLWCFQLFHFKYYFSITNYMIKGFP